MIPPISVILYSQFLWYFICIFAISTKTNPISSSSYTFKSFPTIPIYPSQMHPSIHSSQIPIYPSQMHPSIHSSQSPIYPSQMHPSIHSSQIPIYPSQMHPSIHSSQIPIYPFQMHPSIHSSQIPTHSDRFINRKFVGWLHSR